MKQKFFLPALMVICLSSSAQTESFDSSFYYTAVRNAQQSVFAQPSSSSLLYNGAEYAGYGHGVLGHPFLFSNNFRPASLRYNGARFQDIPLLYDLVYDKLITPYRSNENPMELVNEKVGGFVIDGIRFERIGDDEPATGLREGPGLYAIAFEKDRYALLVKYVKKIKIPANTEKQAFFEEHKTYYIRKGESYFRIEKKSDILQVFSEKKTEIRKQLNKTNLSFSKNPELLLKELLGFYMEIAK